MRIGVLALQGGVEPHVAILERVGHRVVRVRYRRELDRVRGLVLPGGESSVQRDLLRRAGLEAPLLRGIDGGLAVLATCAGLILLAERVDGFDRRATARLDVAVRRNGWGRQVESFEARSDRGRALVFIRAPRIVSVGPDVEILDTLAGEPVLVRQGRLVAATFHPELTPDPCVARIAFHEGAGERAADSGAPRRDGGRIGDPALRLDRHCAQ